MSRDEGWVADFRNSDFGFFQIGFAVSLKILRYLRLGLFIFHVSFGFFAVVPVSNGYGAAFLFVMAEGIGIPTPGQTLLMASALEAAAGRMNIALLLILVTTAATVGNSIGYVIGRWGGRVVLEKFKVNLERQQRLEDLFQRRGGVVILLARFLDGLRQLNGIVAGVLRMPWWTFTIYNVAGAILWTCAWGLGSYYLGRDIHVIAAFFLRHRRLLLALGITAFIALVVYLLRSRVKKDQVPLISNR